MNVDDRRSAVLALMENLQRQDLNFFEEAEGIVSLIQDFGLTQEEMCIRDRRDNFLQHLSEWDLF